MNLTNKRALCDVKTGPCHVGALMIVVGEP